MTRPRILLVPTLTELEWKIKPQLEEWAEVASFDAPGVGSEPPAEVTMNVIAERGLAELDRLGWDRCVVVGDEVGVPSAVRLAGARPEAVQALALGHATLSFTSTGPRPRINAEVLDAVTRMAETDYRSYVRALSQVTQHAYDDDFAQRYMERVPQDVVAAYTKNLMSEAAGEQLEPTLRSLDVPLLFVEHKGCLLWTREGFEDAAAAFPDATTASMELKPSVNPEFAEILQEFCAELPAPTSARAD